MTRRRVILLALLLLVVPAIGDQIQYSRPVEAAPQPEDIGGGYVVPAVQRPAPRPQWREVADVGVLAAGLATAAWLVLRRRSRAGLFLLAAGGVAYFGFYRRGCVCPIGAIQNVTVALTDPQYVLSYVVIAIFFLPLVAALLFGRVFCAGVCPLGGIQELVLLRPVRVPRRLDRVLGWLKWIYLGLAIVLAARPAAVRDFIICRFDPFVPLYRMAGPLHIFLIGGGLLLLGLVIGRPYCRWLCPYGALLSLAARLSWKRVQITPDRELECGLCDEACPYGAIEHLRAVRSACFACGRCYRHCPRHAQAARQGGPP